MDARIQKLEEELKRKTDLLVKIVEELYGSPHKHVKELRNEIIDELSTTKPS